MKIVVILVLVAFSSPALAVPRCAAVVRNFHGSWGNLEDYVWSYPSDQQRHVRACLRRAK